MKSLKPTDLKPHFLFNADGDLFIQISVGKDTLTKPIPSIQTKEDAEKYINKLVPEMAKEIYAKRRETLRLKKIFQGKERLG